MKKPLIGILLTTVLNAGSAFAGPSPMVPGPAMTTTTESGWEFTLSLYGWAAGLDGDVGAAGYVSSIDLSFSDIIDTLDMTAMGLVEMRKGRWMFQLEGLYLKNSIDGVISTPSSGDFDGEFTAKTVRVEGIAGYSVVDNECTRLDAFAGVVYYDITNELDVRGTPFDEKSSDSWFDPVVGLRLSQRLGGAWSAVLRGEVGGFGVSADLTWQASALLGYDIGDSCTLYLGYRHASVDYQNGDFLYDTATSGPVLGLAFHW